jgi:glycosyltransferase involved in cell wall biosynthesis
MFVGNLKPHKNLERLLQAFAKIEQKDECCLLLVGKAFEKYNVLENIEKELNIQKQVIHTGKVSNENLVDLYNLADLFIFPSLYEGFGLPILEALACETKVACSNNSSLPEVGGDVVTYFDATNIYNMKEKIEEALNYELTEDDKIKMKQQVEKFNYSHTEEQIKNIIKI